MRCTWNKVSTRRTWSKAGILDKEPRKRVITRQWICQSRFYGCATWKMSVRSSFFLFLSALFSCRRLVHRRWHINIPDLFKTPLLSVNPYATHFSLSSSTIPLSRTFFDFLSILKKLYEKKIIFDRICLEVTTFLVRKLLTTSFFFPSFATFTFLFFTTNNCLLNNCLPIFFRDKLV